MRELALSQSKVTLIDDEDFEWVSCYKWYAVKGKGAWYARGQVQGKYVYLHRLLLDAPEGMDVDHRNGDGLDNRRANIRICTHSQNLANSRKQVGGSSRWKGVCWERRRKRWRAHVRVNYKHLHLGYFGCEEDAARAYNVAAREAFGDFALLNQIGKELPCLS